MEDLKKILSEHPFFRDLAPEYLEAIVGCASNARFNTNEYLFKEGQPAEKFFLIRHGLVAIETYIPGQAPLTIQTVEEGNVMGWSWLFPPHRWHFDARALELTRAIVMDGKCIRDKSEKDKVLGYELMVRFARVLQERLESTRLQLVDVYKSPKYATIFNR
ncbi:MAG: cyclic nucleotide-binding domain-containing protein [Calditrichaceae bacterium]|nr:cyclic nucleotide-binding domain-containing protein [Calditrichia bacterium]NUQ39849.1 cyclic nucleotide-binding domain-containing protein [Calditrichaceae bacterium]